MEIRRRDARVVLYGLGKPSNDMRAIEVSEAKGDSAFLTEGATQAKAQA